MLFLRALILFSFILSGYFLGEQFNGRGMEAAGAALALGAVMLMTEKSLRQVTLGAAIGGVTGLALGLLTSWLLLLPFAKVVSNFHGVATLCLGVVLGYGGFLAGVQKAKGLTFSKMMRTVKGQESEHLKILDTSVIIDGRIADICETGFIEGAFIVPQFILHELQHIADSADSLKRARGRRGLDILQRMQKMHQINVRIVEDDFPKIREVDAKLVALGTALGAKVVTNDFNLNKVAELQGVQVLNINELANAIKPLVLPGEPLRVFVIKEGKEQKQGVAYLEDGTMVVVDGGRRHIGQNIDVTVTSVLQTTAGRMIFTKPREEYDREAVKAGN